MNELNSLETLLRSWKPRGPSARVERRLFAERREPRAAGTAGVSLLDAAHWLASAQHAGWTAAACLLLLAGAAFHGAGPRRAAAEGAFPVLAVSFSNQSWAATLAWAHAPHNSCSAPILGWTKEENIPSTSRSLDQLSTNHLLPKL